MTMLKLMLALMIIALLEEMFSPCDGFAPAGRRFTGKRNINANRHRIQHLSDFNIIDTDDFKASDETNMAGDFRYKTN